MSAATAQPFTYQPLQGTEIRLIWFNPGGDSGKGVIDCGLKHMLLHDDDDDTSVSRATYFALSYFWGDASQKVPILVDGRSFEVTFNLYAALVRLRAWAGDNPENLSAYYFWADAICINQVDINEKSRQVPRVKNIYHRAHRVLAWLGPNSPAEEKMIGCIFQQAYKANLSAPALAEEVMINEKEMGNLPIAEEMGGRFEDFISAFCSLLNRPWFKRVWIIQEVSLSRQSPLVISGVHETPLEGLFQVFLAVDDHQSSRLDSVRAKKPSRTILAYSSIRRLYWAFILKESSKACGKDLETQEAAFAECFMEILENSVGRFEATMPHDYLYGIMGMALGALRLEDLSPNLFPDYNLPFSEVFYRFTVFLILRKKSILFLGSARNGLSNVPSWVPDFRFMGYISDLRQPHLSVEAHFSSDCRRLSLEGVKLGSCHVIFPLIRDDNTRSIYTVLEDFESAVLCSAMQLNEEYGETMPTLRADWIQSMAILVDPIENSAHPLDYEGLGQRKLCDLDAEMIDMLRKGLEMVTHFVLDNGTVGALFSLDKELQRGDIVCVLRGMINPSVIRRSGGSDHMFVGEALLVDSDWDILYDEEFFATRGLQEFVLV